MFAFQFEDADGLDFDLDQYPLDAEGFDDGGPLVRLAITGTVVQLKAWAASGSRS